jgi:galactose-1-phosphate uridylyltransferase
MTSNNPKYERQRRIIASSAYKSWLQVCCSRHDLPAHVKRAKQEELYNRTNLSDENIERLLKIIKEETDG